MATKRRASTEGQRNTVVIAILGVALLAALAFIVISFFGDTAGEADPEPAQLGVTAGEVVENPDEYRDDTVTVSGEVNQVFGTFTYSIGGERFANGQELLIIGPPPPVGEGIDDEDPLREEEIFEEDLVQVTGQVIDFDQAQIEEEIGAELEGDIPEELTAQPVLLAEGSVVTPRLRADAGELVDISDVMSDPEEHMEQSVTVESEITDTIGDYVFVLDDQLLVLDGSETITESALEDAETASVTGEITMYDASVIEDYTGDAVGLEELEAYEDHPIMTAETVLLLPPEAD